MCLQDNWKQVRAPATAAISETERRANGQKRAEARVFAHIGSGGACATKNNPTRRLEKGFHHKQRAFCTIKKQSVRGRRLRRSRAKLHWFSRCVAWRACGQLRVGSYSVVANCCAGLARYSCHQMLAPGAVTGRPVASLTATWSTSCDSRVPWRKCGILKKQGIVAYLRRGSGPPKHLNGVWMLETRTGVLNRSSNRIHLAISSLNSNKSI